MGAEESEENLVHCIYASAATDAFAMSDIEKLLHAARKKNAELGVTGMLLYEYGSFFQVLEGARDTVHHLYEVISADKRHQRVTKVIFEPIETRAFSDWSMGLAEVSKRQLNEIEGLNDFFRAGSCFVDLDEGRAKKLLCAFKQGRWRSTIGE